MYGRTKSSLHCTSYKLVQISPIMILVNSGSFLSISSWFLRAHRTNFVMIPYISSSGYFPKTQGIMGHVQVANDVNNLGTKCRYLLAQLINIRRVRILFVACTRLYIFKSSAVHTCVSCIRS